MNAKWPLSGVVIADFSSLFSSLEGELIVHLYIHASASVVVVVVHHFETSSHSKLPFQSKPNFMLCHLRKWGRNGPGHMTKVAAMPIYGKNL